ncbi:unnamed protein product, partial [Phaeothamnion confervicola]
MLAQGHLKIFALVLLALGGLDSHADSDGSGDLNPIAASDWDRAKAQHLLERAGFGGTPREIDKLARMTPRQAVRYLVYFEGVDAQAIKAQPPFDESGIFEAGLDP